MMNSGKGSEGDAMSGYCSSSRGERTTLRDQARRRRVGLTCKAKSYAVVDDVHAYENTDGSSQISMGLANFNPQKGNVSKPRRSSRVPSGRESQPEGQSQSNSSGRLDLGYVYGGQRNDVRGCNGIEYSEDDRAELLRKIDELKDQLNRSFDASDHRPKERVPFDRMVFRQDPYAAAGHWNAESALGTDRASASCSDPDKHVAMPSYMNRSNEPSSYGNRREMAGRSFHPPAADPVRAQMLSTGTYQTAAYLPGRHVNTANMKDTYDSYPPRVPRHHPSCSCFHCYNSRIPPQDLPYNAMLYSRETLARFDPRDFNPGSVSNHPQPLTRHPADLNSEVGCYVRRRPPGARLAAGVLRCYAVAGGAPFLACCNCLEVLQLPNKVFLRSKEQEKLRCGACSSVLLVAAANKRLVVFVDNEASKTTGEADDGHRTLPDKGNSYSQDRINRARMNFSSEEFDSPSREFHPADREMHLRSTGHDSSYKTAEMSLYSSSSSTSGEEDDLVDSKATRKSSNTVEVLMAGKAVPPAAGSSLQDCFEYSNKYNRAKPLGDGDKSERSESEKVIPVIATSYQGSTKEESLATEIEISSYEFSNTGTSLDSGESSRREQWKNRAAKKILSGMARKSFGDFSTSNRTDERENSKVTVNGHLITGPMIKKAEKLSGPVHPGNYWYDFRSGFWGVVGGHCLGVIPPFIEEFNYLMPENCAGGNTGVFVNGRELHPKDLKLLGGRGLPTETDRSYIIEISGRVLDVDTGEELQSLGKLAPTVARLKRGFGMKPPKAAAN